MQSRKEEEVGNSLHASYQAAERRRRRTPCEDAPNTARPRPALRDHSVRALGGAGRQRGSTHLKTGIKPAEKLFIAASKVTNVKANN